MSVTIYIPLLDEGTTVWRPVEATQVDGGAFRIDTLNPDPDTEAWAYTTGELVRCQPRVLSEVEVLVAFERSDSNEP